MLAVSWMEVCSHCWAYRVSPDVFGVSKVVVILTVLTDFSTSNSYRIDIF